MTSFAKHGISLNIPQFGLFFVYSDENADLVFNIKYVNWQTQTKLLYNVSFKSNEFTYISNVVVQFQIH